jgi:hypothetical protein
MPVIRDLIEEGKGGAGRVWWLWELLDEEVLRVADSSAVAGV